MKFTLVHIFPNGTERPVSVPSPAIRKAANLAAMSLHDNRRASKADAQEFAAQLTALPVGQTLTHEASGYAARIERADATTPTEPNQSQ
ncbi:hypothetical protein EES39_38500 [Streptomyces sp. ADI92-24]|uniref:hypothetical protein n=1 Tax=Streptomyces sp. ADI92-24 TaxID=1522756 RepID=UPI000F556972|nr:hypothetical protein [Streptomyces sp. ADI92-24]RPK32380.1 hypothetical protein EES39_38500 [Streptomyces sp. ADI92-24]